MNMNPFAPKAQQTATETVPPIQPVQQPVQDVTTNADQLTQQLAGDVGVVPAQVQAAPAQAVQPIQPVQEQVAPTQSVQPAQAVQPAQPVQEQVQVAPAQVTPAQPVQEQVQVAPAQVTPAQPAQEQVQVAPAQVAQPVPIQPGAVVQPAQPIPPAQPVQPVTQQAAPNPMMAQPATQQTKVQPVGYVPTLEPGQSIVSRFSPAKFDAFVKVLNVLDDRNIIVIDQSRICQSINNGTATLITDVSGLIDDANNKISLHVLNPKKYIRYFKNIKGSSDIYIIDDPVGQRYIVTNGDIMIYLPKQIEEFERDAAPPDLSSATIVGTAIDVDKETRSVITSMMSETSHVDLLIHQNQMKAVYVPELAVFSFKQYVDEHIDDSKAELRLRSYSFLNIPGEEYRVTLGEIQGNYWITTLVNTGFIAVHIIESLQPVSDENLIL